VQVPFEEAMVDATGGNPKVLTSALAETGRFPVVDQGQEFVSGYVDDEELLCRKSSDAVIIFGDHTKVIKYVDFDFVLGADGVKVLEARSDFNTRFLFHYLNTVRLPSNLGYSRHFKYLKRKSVPKPEIEVQRRIAIILDKADTIHKNRIKAVTTASEYLRSVFFELFGDPVGNSKGLREIPIADIATVTTGNTPSREVPAYYGDDIEWIKSDNINTPSHFLTKATEGLSETGLRVGRSAPAGSTLITCIAGSPSCIGNAALADRPVSFNQQINALTPKLGIEPEFIYATTLFSKRRIQAASTNGMKGMVSKGALERVRFILPPPDQRQKFVAIFQKVMALTEKLEAAASEASMLYDALAQKAFQGQLTGLQR
jgi:type I restriction enzyme, S subunit